MKSRYSLHAIGIACLLALGAASVHAVEFTDPKGDDKGPGTYVYPTDGVYKAGSFDITKFSAVKSGANVDFSVEVAAGLDDPWGMGGGFAVQMLFVFIKTGAGGNTATPPGLNVVFAAGHEWNKLVILSPQKKARVTGEAEAKAGALAKDIVVPNITRGRGRVITGSVALAELGGDGNVDGWSYQVVMQSNEGFPAAGDFLTRKVNEYEGQHRFGGGNDADCDPHVMDVLEGPEAKQSEMLAYTCGPDGKATKAATLKMIKK